MTRQRNDSELRNKKFQGTFFPLLFIPIGGLIALGICYLIYLSIYNFVELRFFPNDPLSLPASTLRRSYALVLLILYVILLRTRISDLIKSTVLVGPLGIFLTTSILTFSEKPVWAILFIAAIVAVIPLLLYRYRKPWFYYYAVAITALASIALAWPET